MFLKLSKFFLYVSIFSVLVVMTGTFFPFIGGKTYFFRATIELSLIFTLFWWAFEAPEGEVWKRCKTLFQKPLFAAVSGFALMFMLATLFAFDKHAAFWSNYERGEGGFQMLHYYALFFLLSLLFRERKDWQRLFWVSIAAAVCMIIYGIGAAVFIVNPETGAISNPFGFVGPYASQGKLAAPTFLGRLFSDARFQGSLGNPAYVAPYLIFSMFYLLWMWILKSTKETYKETFRDFLYGIAGAFSTLFLVMFFSASDHSVPNYQSVFLYFIEAVFIVSILAGFFYFLWLRASESGKTTLKNVSYGVLGLFFVIFFLLSQTKGAFLGLGAAVFVFLAYIAFASSAELRERISNISALLITGSLSLISYFQPAFFKSAFAGFIQKLPPSVQGYIVKLFHNYGAEILLVFATVIFLLLIYIPLSTSFSDSSRRKIKFLTFLFLVTVVFSLSFFVFRAVNSPTISVFAPESYGSEASKAPVNRLFDISLDNKTFETRLWTWNSAWQGFKEKPILGWGPENFSAVFDKYFDPRHFIPGQQGETWFDYAHSIIFDYLSETGILGLLSYLAIFVVFYLELFKKFKNENKILKALLVSLPFGYLVQGLALFNVFAIYINIFLFMAFACYEFYYSDEHKQ
ncbi:MAG: O-antigen ligase family protein [Candidatus Liptonbacteria bacterium]|nr:O-antigen ligase family protein [Candidatus Liptonbacteria bacterium]